MYEGYLSKKYRELQLVICHIFQTHSKEINSVKKIAFSYLFLTTFWFF